MTTANTIEKLQQMNIDNLIYLNNQYCSDINDDTGFIYENSDDILNELYQEPAELLRRTYYGNYSYNDPYFRINAYGNIISLTEKSILTEIDISVLAEWIEENEIPLF